MPKVRDLTGQTFGKWTVLYRAERTPRAWWLCRCACKREYVIRGSHLTSGLSKRCRECGYASLETPIRKDSVVYHRSKGESVRSIAERLGCHQDTLRKHMGWSMEDPQRQSLWMHQHSDKIMEARKLGYTWAHIFYGYEVPYTSPRSLQTAFCSYRCTQLRRELKTKLREWEKTKQSREVHELLKQGVSVEDISKQLWIPSRIVLRLRKKTLVPLGIPTIDMQRATKLVMRGIGFGQVNERLGSPVFTTQEFKVLYNFWVDHQNKLSL